MPYNDLAQAAVWVAIASVPLVFVGCTFLNAAQRPQWVWVMSGRTQIVWLATLALGTAVIPIGIPAAIYYLIRIRPILVAVESGDISDLS